MCNLSSSLSCVVVMTAVLQKSSGLPVSVPLAIDLNVDTRLQLYTS